MSLRRSNKPSRATGMRANHVRLIHIQQPRVFDDPCDHCGESYTHQLEHWRVRANMMIDGKWESLIGHFCSEACARHECNALRVEISLLTDRRSTCEEVMFDQVAKHATDRGK